MMVLDRIPGTGSNEPDLTRGKGGGRLRISVVHTTIEGTLAALNAAAQHARGLCADIAIIVTEVVPFRYPLEAAPVPVGFFEALCLALIEESGLEKSACDIEIHFCRDQAACLEAVLRPKSLVVIGAKRCLWPRRERRLEKALKLKGFDTVLVRAKSRSIESCSERVVRRMTVEGGPRGHLCEHSGRFDLH